MDQTRRLSETLGTEDNWNNNRSGDMDLKLLPKNVIVELNDIFYKYSQYQGLTEIYRYFPLQDMVRLILTTGLQCTEGNELLFIELGTRLPGDFVLDTFNLSVLFDALAIDVDESIRIKFPAYYYTGQYLFDRWVDVSSAMLYNYAV